MTLHLKKIDQSFYWQFLIVLAIFGYLLGSNSCANQGVGPQGGPRDSIPPLITNSSPQPFQTNFKGNEINLSFNEYVVADNLTGNLVVSPPLAEKITVKMKGKSILIKFNEELTPDRTYSIDFKDAIKDYTEGNKLEGFRMLFSTYDQIDTLRIEGYLLDAFTHEPVINAMATLYSLDVDSLFTTSKPDYIAKANEKGYFLFDNLKEGSYRLFGLIDGDNNLYFSRITEQIAFFDSLIVPSALFVVEPDTISEENDSIVHLNTYTEYSPPPVFNFLFSEEEFNQRLGYFRRESKTRMILDFFESLTDSFEMELLGIDKELEWSYIEYGQNRDSVFIWIIDSITANTDSLSLKIEYTVSDSLNNYLTQTDTLNMIYIPPRVPARPAQAIDEDEGIKLVHFDFKTNITANNHDLNKPIVITTPEPVKPIEPHAIRVEIVVNDSTFEAVAIDVQPMLNSKRNFIIDFELQEATAYRLTIDSASVENYQGHFNNGVELDFKTQKMEFYGNAIFELKGFDSHGVVQLLKNTKDEEVLFEKVKPESVTAVTFDYLKPGKYRVKLFADLNQNGKWDGGSFADKNQPEPVYYFPKIINIKSNWDLKETWEIEQGVFQIKDLNDPDKVESK